MSRHSRYSVAIAAAVALGLPTIAAAQGVVPSLTNGPVVQPREEQAPPKQLPPAIPGAQPQQGAVAPSKAIPMDMAPNDALFDAINRGDLAAAKDALNRGADLFATNILGMTPTELSVDLGHKDITFLLLSLRPAAMQELAPPPKVAQRAPARGEKPGRQQAAIHATVTASASSPPASLAPRQFAGDGGTPVPQAGFLGFGSIAR